MSSATGAADPDEGLHIGQHACGLEFLFQAHPDLGLTDCDAWSDYLDRPGVEIVADHGAVEPFPEFRAAATARPAHVGGPNAMGPRWWAGLGRVTPAMRTAIRSAVTLSIELLGEVRSRRKKRRIGAGR